jgi:hypothetical protein
MAMLHRTLIVTALVTATLGLAAVPAGARPPVQVRYTDPATFVLPGGVVCDFDVQVDVQQKVKVITFRSERGAAFGGLSTGKIRVVLTNLETDDSRRLSIPGPSFFDVDGNLVIGTGPWLVWEPGAIRYLVGRMRFVPGPLGLHAVLLDGREIDYCDVLD